MRSSDVHDEFVKFKGYNQLSLLDFLCVCVRACWLRRIIAPGSRAPADLRTYVEMCGFEQTPCLYAYAIGSSDFRRINHCVPSNFTLFRRIRPLALPSGYSKVKRTELQYDGNQRNQCLQSYSQHLCCRLRFLRPRDTLSPHALETNIGYY